MKIRHYFLASLLLLLATWLWWSYGGRKYPAPPPVAPPTVMQSLQYDTTCPRNVVAIQPWMEPEDYLSEEHFYKKLDGYLNHARQAAYLHSRTVVLFPEYLGSWLILAGEKQSVTRCQTIQGAMTTLVLSNFPAFVRHWFLFNPEKTTEAALFRMKAATMAHIYTTAFRRLASSYGVTIVGGSIILPDPTVFNNEIAVHLTGELYNTSFVFYPDGSISKEPVKKSFLTAEEQTFATSCPITQLPVFNTPAGKMAVLICADSWFPESYHQALSNHAEIILVPSYATGHGTMNRIWKGYDGQPTPADVDRTDIGVITEAQAWQKYALPGRLPPEAVLGVNIFLRGNFWNVGSDGHTFIVHRGKTANIQQSGRDGIWNICF